MVMVTGDFRNGSVGDLSGETVSESQAGSPHKLMTLPPVPAAHIPHYVSPSRPGAT